MMETSNEAVPGKWTLWRRATQSSVRLVIGERVGHISL
jgi:hypothetical protein